MTTTLKLAGAGSGKTYTTEHDICDKLIAGTIKPSEIVAVTFTRKAASELQERIILNLLERGETAIATAVMNARIGTVHSVFGELLSDYAFELGLAPDIRVIDDSDKSTLLAEALDQCLSVAEVQRLNQLSRRLKVDDWQETLLEVIEQARVNNLNPADLPNFAANSCNKLLAILPAADPAITEASLNDELKIAVNQARKVSNPTKGLTATIEKVDKMLRQSKLNWQNWTQVSKLNPTNMGKPIFATAMDLGLQVLRCPEFQSELQKYIVELLLAAKQTLQVFAELKASRGLVDFVDQEKLAFEALHTPLVQASLKEQIHYLVVDEFQDTSPLQLALFAKLSEFVDDILLVGDAKQAIYGFRGSDPKLTLDVLQHVQTGGGVIDTLPNSWRSRSGLVHFCNELFTKPFAHILSKDQVQLAPQQTYTLTTPELENWKLNGSNNGLRMQALAASILEHFLAQPEVWDKTNQCARPLKWRDMAVLCRSNNEAAEIAQACAKIGVPIALERSGLLATPEVTLAIACLRRLIDPNDSLASAEILSLAHGQNASGWLDNRLDAITTDTAADWNKQAHPILEQLEQARADIHLMSIKEALLAAMQAADIQQIVISWNESERLADHRLANLSQLVDLISDYENHCQAHHLAGTVTGFVIWLRDQEQCSEDNQASNPGDAVNIQTYHRSKGLEWPVVICLSLDSKLKCSLFGVRINTTVTKFDWHDPLAGREINFWPNPFPDQQGKDPLTELMSQTPEWAEAEQQAKNEAIQLLYVGFTRARDQLILTEAAKMKSSVGAWLGLLKSPLLPFDDGIITLPSGEQLQAVHKSCEVPDKIRSGSTARTRFWLPKSKAKPNKYELFLRPPSSEPEVASASSYIISDFDHRISVNGNPEMELVGEVIHHCLALTLATPTINPDILKQVVLSHVPGTIDSAQVLQSGLNLLDWIHTEYPGAKFHTELPFSRMLPSGQLQSGQIDLVLELDNSWVIIDHKSNPQPKTKWLEIAQQHSGQLAAYKNALETLSDKPVIRSLIYLSVSGGLVELK